MADYKVNIGAYQKDVPGTDYYVNIGADQTDAPSEEVEAVNALFFGTEF